MFHLEPPSQILDGGSRCYCPSPGPPKGRGLCCQLLRPLQVWTLSFVGTAPCSQRCLLGRLSGTIRVWSGLALHFPGALNAGRDVGRLPRSCPFPSDGPSPPHSAHGAWQQQECCPLSTRPQGCSCPVPRPCHPHLIEARGLAVLGAACATCLVSLPEDEPFRPSTGLARVCVSRWGRGLCAQ